MKRNALMIALMAVGTWGAASTALAQEADVARGKALVEQVCVACHGVDGNSVVPTFPKVAGMHYEYTLKQLQEFRSGKRVSPVMQPLVADLTEQNMRDVAAYFATQKATEAPVTDEAVLAAGQHLFDHGNHETGVPACAGCHGTEGLGNARFPRLSGQHPDYVLDQMKQFAAGQRSNDKRMMQTIASRLTEEEIHAVAQYIASMP